MTGFYPEDLAYIHNVGFQDHALKSAPDILEIGLLRLNNRLIN
jgi:hypothetical protein